MAEDPLTIRVGSIVCCTTCFDEEITGEVAAFEKQTQFLVLKQAVSGRPSCFADVTFLNLTKVKEFNIVKEAAAPTEVTLQPHDINMLFKRRDRALEKKQRMIDAINANVSEEGRDLFAYICKTLDDVTWNGTSIVVLNDVTVTDPYTPDCVTSRTGNKQALQHITKIMEKFTRDRSSNSTTNKTPV